MAVIRGDDESRRNCVLPLAADGGKKEDAVVGPALLLVLVDGKTDGDEGKDADAFAVLAVARRPSVPALLQTVSTACAGVRVGAGVIRSAAELMFPAASYAMDE
jgi:hypothetical protein